PKSKEETARAIQENLREETDSKSTEMNRRIRKPRKASSSAIGTVITALITRMHIQVTRTMSEDAASARGMPAPELFPAIHRMKTRVPAARASHPNRHLSSR